MIVGMNNNNSDNMTGSGRSLLLITLTTLAITVVLILAMRSNSDNNYVKAHVPAVDCVKLYEQSRIGTVCTEVKADSVHATRINNR